MSGNSSDSVGGAFRVERWECPEQPEWSALENVLGPEFPQIGRFMLFVGISTCAENRRIITYKHSLTRRSLHIDGQGRFYRHAMDTVGIFYVEIEPEAALRHCLPDSVRGSSDDAQ